MAESWSRWIAFKEKQQLSSDRLAETDIIEREEIVEEVEMREMGEEQDASGRGVDDGGGMGANQGWTEGRVWRGKSICRGKSIETWIELARSMQEVKVEMRQLVVQARHRVRDGNDALRDRHAGRTSQIGIRQHAPVLYR